MHIVIAPFEGIQIDGRLGKNNPVLHPLALCPYPSKLFAIHYGTRPCCAGSQAPTPTRADQGRPEPNSDIWIVDQSQPEI
jgi:hypothetical protein